MKHEYQRKPSTIPQYGLEETLVVICTGCIDKC